MPSEGVAMKTVLRHIRHVALLHAGDRDTDGALLESFVSRRDEAAFEMLLRRHGPMVLGVCRRVLGNVHDAEDAFQATFLVLARKAASVRPRELVGHWLYGVAYRTALKARAMNARRRVRERRARGLQCAQPSADDGAEELLAQLDAALSRLPDKYRVVVVLCELEGKARRHVARLLGIPEGTVAWRLAHAKKLLARRLSRYGAAISTGSLAALLSRDAASECVPASLLHSTARAAVLTAGAVSARVVELTEGVIKAMLLSKLKLVWAVGLAAVVGVGAVGLTYRQAAAQVAPANTPSRAAQATADELEELRLEVAALRKGLEVTRARVKALEHQVETLAAGRHGANDTTRDGKFQNLTRSVGVGNVEGASKQTDLPQGTKPADPGKAQEPSKQTDLPQGTKPADPGKAQEPSKQTDLPQGTKPADAAHDGSKNSPNSNRPPQASQHLRVHFRYSADPLGTAEAALKTLRANPNDKQAADTLERALKQLKVDQKKRIRIRFPEQPENGKNVD
jgi:RNA polymerase sigma factor (sigma-70 family)